LYRKCITMYTGESVTFRLSPEEYQEAKRIAEMASKAGMLKKDRQ